MRTSLRLVTVASFAFFLVAGPVAGATTLPVRHAGPVVQLRGDEALARALIWRRAADRDVRFVPLGSKLAGDAVLQGHVYDWTGDPAAGCDVQWLTTADDTPATAWTTTGSDGAYSFSAVPGAAGQGEVWAYGSHLTPWFWFGRMRASWPDTGTTTFDFQSGRVSASPVRGGPWSQYPASPELWLYGADDVSDLTCATSLGGYGSTALAGLYDLAAGYFYLNEGLELPVSIRVWPRAATGFLASYGLNALTFIDAEHGWAVGDENGVLATADGGRSWTRLSDTIPWGLLGSDFRDVDFVDATHGWIVGMDPTGTGRIGATADGGQSWTPQGRFSFDGWQSVDFIDSEHGWVAGGDRIDRTDDGGASWTQVTVAGASLRAVSFVDALHGWACGSLGRLLVTTDGGETWDEQASGTSADLNDLKFVDVGHGWAVGASGSIIATADGGLTWSRQSSDVTGNLVAVDFVDQSRGAVCGPGGVCATVDGGHTWSSHGSGPNDDICLAGSTQGWGVSMSDVVETHDNCATWTDPYPGFDEANAQRAYITKPTWASGRPGSRVALRLENFPAAWVSSVWGYPSYPTTAAARALGSYTSKGAFREAVSRTLPATAEPGYAYAFGLNHEPGPLYLETHFQVCTLKSTKTVDRARAAPIKLSGVIPTEGHWGSHGRQGQVRHHLQAHDVRVGGADGVGPDEEGLDEGRARQGERPRQVRERVPQAVLAPRGTSSATRATTGTGALTPRC